MSHEFIKFGDRVAYSSQTEGKIQILEDLKQTTKRFLEFARAAEMAASGEEGTTSSPAGSQGRVVSEASQSLAEVHRQVEPTAPSIPHPQAFLPSDLGFSMPFKSSTLFSTTAPNPTYSKIGQFSPHLTYGILTNYFPSHLWSRYQISGSNSFATRICMETLMMIILALQGQMDLPGFIPSVFRYRFRHDNSSDFISLATNQLAYIATT
jgi:hypothetical protein